VKTPNLDKLVEDFFLSSVSERETAPLSLRSIRPEGARTDSVQ